LFLNISAVVNATVSCVNC